MTTAPLFISRVNVANAQDTTLIILGAPAGPVQDGQIAIVEVARLVVSHQTLKEVAELLAEKVKENEDRAKLAARERAAKTRAENRAFASSPDDDGKVTTLRISH